MPAGDVKTMPEADRVQAVQLDLSRLVGHTIKVFSDQMPGREMVTKVLACAAQELQVNNSGSDGLLKNLVNKKPVVLQFPYKGQAISVRATLKRGQGGRCYFELSKQVMPLSQRRFYRVRLVGPVNLAPVPSATVARLDVSRLRWMRTDTVNFSSGGVMLNMSSFVQEGVCMLLHVDVPGADLLPDLLLAQVRHCHQVDFALYKIGVEFLVRESCRKRLSANRLRQLPPVTLTYSVRNREQLNNTVRAWMQNDNQMD